MKNRTERDAEIFSLWDKCKLTFRQIAELYFPSYLSMETVRNIVYSCNSKQLKTESECIKLGLNTELSKEIYKLFRLKFLEFQNVNNAILFVYRNQPLHKLSESSIRRIITDVLNQKKSKQHIV